MKELFAFLKRFIRPYLRNLIGSVSYNLLSALLNVFSFALLIPILRILLCALFTGSGNGRFIQCA